MNNGKPTTIRHLRAGSNERHHQSLGGVMIHTAAEPQLSGTGSLYRAAAMYWLVLAGTATVAGIARETWLVPRLGELRSHQLGTIIVCASFLAVIAAIMSMHIRHIPAVATTRMHHELQIGFAFVRANRDVDRQCLPDLQDYLKPGAGDPCGLRRRGSGRYRCPARHCAARAGVRRRRRSSGHVYERRTRFAGLAGYPSAPELG